MKICCLIVLVMVAHPSSCLHYMPFLIVLGFLGNLSMLSFLLWSLILPCCPVSEVHGNQMIQHLDYGVVFQSRSDLRSANEYWLHIYEIPLPAVLQLPSIGTCHKDNASCLLISHMFSQINAIRVETSIRLNDTIETVRTLIPESGRIKGRSARSLLPFIGQFSKSLFETATTNDVNVLARHIIELTRRTMKTANSLEQQGTHMSSFMSKANTRMDNLMKGIKTMKWQ